MCIETMCNLKSFFFHWLGWCKEILSDGLWLATCHVFTLLPLIYSIKVNCNFPVGNLNTISWLIKEYVYIYYYLWAFIYTAKIGLMNRWDKKQTCHDKIFSNRKRYITYKNVASSFYFLINNWINLFHLSQRFVRTVFCSLVLK